MRRLLWCFFGVMVVAQLVAPACAIAAGESESGTPVTVAFLTPIAPGDPTVVLGMDVQLLARANGNTDVPFVTEYRLDGGSWQVYASAFTVWDNGPHTLDYRTTDALGCVGEVGSSTFEITVPMPTLDVTLHGELVDGVYQSPVDMFLWVDDNGGWPVMQTEASTDGVTWFPVYNNFTVWEEGPHTYWFRAITWNGSVSEPVRVDFAIRFPRPVSQAFVLGDQIAPEMYISPARVAFSYHSGFFGIRLIEWRLAGESEWNTWDFYDYDIQPLEFAHAGDYTLEYRAVDEMGYAEDVKQISFSVIEPRPESMVQLGGVRTGDTEYASPVSAFFHSWAEYVPVDHVEWKLEGDAEWTVWDGSPVIFAEDGAYVLLHRAVDVLGGVEEAHRQLFSIHMVPPITEAVLEGDARENGWFGGPVRVTLQVVDAGTLPELHTQYSLDGQPWNEYDGPFSVERPGVTTVYYRTVSWAGPGEEARSVEISIDGQAPDVYMEWPRDIAEPFLLHAPTPAVDWSAFDALSGVAYEWSSTECGLPLDTASVGEHGLTVVAADHAGNRWEHTFPYRVVYGFSGVLQPLNADGTSVFKVGCTVPVKFRLFDANGQRVTSAQASFSAMRMSSGTSGTQTESASAGAPAIDGRFVYDAKRDEYQYAWGTKGSSRGTYEVRISLDDGTCKTVTVLLK